MNKQVYLGLYFRCEQDSHVWVLLWLHKTKVLKQGKTICYTNTDSFIVHITSEDIFCDLNEEIDKIFNTTTHKKKTKK